MNKIIFALGVLALVSCERGEKQPECNCERVIHERTSQQYLNGSKSIYSKWEEVERMANKCQEPTEEGVVFFIKTKSRELKSINGELVDISIQEGYRIECK